MTKKLLGGLILSALVAAPAMAADMRMPVKAAPMVASAVYNWSGFYVGINGGWARGDLDWRYVNNTTANQHIDGGLLGGHVGYQFQFDRLVLGVEVNVLGASLDGSSSCPNAAFRCDTEARWLWTVGPRAGLAVSNVLFYGTGGFASGRIKTTTANAATGVQFDASQATHNGWFAGGGIEIGVTPNFIAGIEFTHIDLRGKNHSPTPFSATEVRTIGADINAIRGRLTYKFGGAR